MIVAERASGTRRADPAPEVAAIGAAVARRHGCTSPTSLRAGRRHPPHHEREAGAPRLPRASTCGVPSRRSPPPECEWASCAREFGVRRSGHVRWQGHARRPREFSRGRCRGPLHQFAVEDKRLVDQPTVLVAVIDLQQRFASVDADDLEAQVRDAIGEVNSTSSWKCASTASMSRAFQARTHSRRTGRALVWISASASEIGGHRSRHSHSEQMCRGASSVTVTPRPCRFSASDFSGGV